MPQLLDRTRIDFDPFTGKTTLTSSSKLSGPSPMLKTTSNHAIRWFSLRTLLPYASIVREADIQFSHVTQDSRDCKTGSLFAAIDGENCRGRDYVSDAISRGASGVLTNQPIAHLSIPQCIVPNVRLAYGKLCQSVAGNPSQKLILSAITGTNGKTTTSWLLRSILKHANQKTALLGTVDNEDGEISEPSQMTTLENSQLAGWMQRSVANGCTHLVMEASSHALTQGRLAGVQLSQAVLTNITRDHLDYHGSFKNYLASKMSLLDYLKAEGSIISNSDDLWLKRVFQHAVRKTQVYRYGAAESTPAVALVPVQQDFTGTDLELRFPNSAESGKQIVHKVRVPLIGRMNLENIWAAVTAALALGIVPEQMIDGLQHFKPVPGRMQPVANTQGIHVYVDYAHTPDAMTAVLKAVRPLCHQKLICVFGAGGNRDQGKRAGMGAAACLADSVILTNDNPRHEDPQLILNEIATGIGAEIPTQVIQDREAAIAQAIRLAQPGDCVMILGKGHETTQQVGDQKLSFNDADVASSLLATHSLPLTRRIPA